MGNLLTHYIFGFRNHAVDKTFGSFRSLHIQQGIVITFTKRKLKIAHILGKRDRMRGELGERRALLLDKREGACRLWTEVST